MRNILISIILICCMSCQSGNTKREAEPASVPTLDSLIAMNRKMLQLDMQKIEEYISSSDMEMSKTGTGLFISLVVDREGQEAKSGDQVIFTYKMKTLKGRFLYSSDELGLREFLVDQSTIEAAWNEAAKLMSVADSAIIIAPPHLAFGHIGDGNRIGSRAIVVYELRLDSVN